MQCKVFSPDAEDLRIFLIRCMIFLTNIVRYMCMCVSARACARVCENYFEMHNRHSSLSARISRLLWPIFCHRVSTNWLNDPSESILDAGPKCIHEVTYWMLTRLTSIWANSLQQPWQSSCDPCNWKANGKLHHFGNADVKDQNKLSFLSAIIFFRYDLIKRKMQISQCKIINIDKYYNSQCI